MIRMEYEQAISVYVCHYCKGSFDHLENLQKHVQQIHTTRSSSKEQKVCPLCGLRCVKSAIYRDHLKHIHRQNEEGRAFALKCFNDFLDWKNELEKRNYCKYIMQGTPRTIQPSNDKFHIYRCDSSTPTTKERRSTWAAKDSCPSMISAIESSKNHSIKVEYWNTHVGHTVPVQEEELDAAIGSLQTAEVVIDEQSYQSVEQDSEGTMYFLNESNDGSFSEAYVKDASKKQPPSLFQNSGSSSPSQTLKPASRKFSFKKDPSKRSVSFSGSLASVACMKATVKKDPVTSTFTATASTTETSDPLPSSEMPELSPGKENEINTKSSSESCTKKSLENERNNSVPSSSSSAQLLQTQGFVPIAPATSASQIKIDNTLPNQSILNSLNTMVNDGKLNGQFILLNSLEAQNGQQSLILCPVGRNLPSGQSTTIVSNNDGQNKDNLKQRGEITSKNPQQISKDNISCVQNVLTLASNVPCPPGVEKIILPPGPSILKKPKATKTTRAKKSPPTGTPKARKRNPRKKLLPLEKTLSLVGATSSTSSNLVTGKVPSTITPNIKGFITVNSPAGNKVNTSKISHVAGNQVLSNSLPPGVAYISINNNLFPINSPTGPLVGSNLNSSYILASPISSAQNTQPAQSLLNFTNFSQPATSFVISNTVTSTTSRAVGKTPVSTKNVSNDTRPVIMISQLGNNRASTPVSSLSNALATIKTYSRSVTSSPSMPKLTKSIVSNTMLQNLTQIRSLMPQNALFKSPVIPTRPFSQLLPGTQAGPRPVAPIPFRLKSVRPIISTTVSNAVQVKRVQMPFSSIITNPTLPTKGNVNLTSKSTDVSSVVLNTKPISSTPTINIPAMPIAHPQKPGAFLFESSGDLYVLEPIEDSTKVNSDLPTKKDKETNDADLGVDKLENTLTYSQKDAASDQTSEEVNTDTEGFLMDGGPAESASETDRVTTSQTGVTAFPNTEIKVDQKLKNLKRCPTIANGKQIVSLPQKRPLKVDDSEILKKVKYYNLEMKYLSSQAECKRLKLELAKAHIKNKGEALSEADLIATDQDFTSEKEDITKIPLVEFSEDLLDNNDELVIDQFAGIKELEKSGTKDEVQNKDDKKHNELEEQLFEDNKENVQVSLDEMNEQREVETQNEKLNIEKDEEIPMDFELVNTEMEKDTAMDLIEQEIINNNSEENNVINSQERHEVEGEAISTQEIEDKSGNNFGIVDTSMDNYELPKAEVIANCSIEDSHLGTYEKDEEMLSNNLSEGKGSCKILEDPINALVESTNVEALVKQAMEISDFENEQYVDDIQMFENTKSSEEQAVIGDQGTDEALKELEIQYGSESSDIYTMIRTSVLRSLYADMKELCKENKKLYVENQKLKNQINTCEVVNEEIQFE